MLILLLAQVLMVLVMFTSRHPAIQSLVSLEFSLKAARKAVPFDWVQETDLLFRVT
jgi:hypothetical protein